MSKELEEAVTMFKNLDMGNDEEFKRARNRILKELERLQEENSKLKRANKIYINSIQSITPVLLEGYIEKDKIREKIIIDKSKLNNCTNSIFGNICKARIEFGQELLEGK